MTRTWYVGRKAEDLRTGNMFVHWAAITSGKYPEGRRILGIQTCKGGQIKIGLDDLSHYKFEPKHVVMVSEVA